MAPTWCVSVRQFSVSGTTNKSFLRLCMTQKLSFKPLSSLYMRTKTVSFSYNSRIFRHFPVSKVTRTQIFVKPLHVIYPYFLYNPLMKKHADQLSSMTFKTAVISFCRFYIFKIFCHTIFHHKLAISFWLIFEKCLICKKRMLCM